MESYGEFRDLSLQGNNFRDLLLEALRDYKKVALNLKQNRELALKKHNPKHNEKTWSNLMLKIIEAESN